MGEAIGLDVIKGKKLEYFGIEGNKQSAYFHDISIELHGGIKFNAYVGFSYDFNKSMPYGILSQKGFFNLFKVIFDYTSEDIEIREKSR